MNPDPEVSHAAAQTRYPDMPASPIPAVLDKRNRVLWPRFLFQGGKQAVETEIYIEKYRFLTHLKPSMSSKFSH